MTRILTSLLLAPMLAPLLALALVLAAGTGAARAAPLDEAFAKLAAGGSDNVEAGILMVVASGDSRSIEILEALADNRLQAGPAGAAIKLANGDLVDAATGQPFAGSPPPGLKPVRANNRIRRAVSAALGQLTLLSPDKAKRLEAATSVFRSRDPTSLPLVEAALEKEQDGQVKQALELARAAVLLHTGTDTQKLEAIPQIRALANADARGLLATIPNPSPAVAAAADEAVAGIDSAMAAWSIAQNAFFGLSLGSVLLLAAIGLAITFGVMGVINMAHGEMVMIGAYVTFMVQEVIRNHAPGLFDWSLAIALPIAFVVAGLVGMAIERGVIRFLYGRPLETLLATFGLSLILQQAVRTIFGPTNREVGNPSWMSGSYELGGMMLTWNRTWIIVFSAVVFVLLLVILRRTAFGLQMRAVTQNRRMAAAMGIRTAWVDSLTFGLGSGVAGIAGVALSQIDNVSPNLGQGYIIDSFMVVVFGGVGNLWGTLVGALSLGVLNKILEPFAGAVLGKIIVLVLLVLFIQRRPRGLFPQKGRAVES
ncbi:urea ABC transporter permease subunit UrtB [Zavarzinia sp. CC-PAN008]|uniref:urea ABC transporter permease subunit UrtB n=1 Tax=Zavarzinia sp. CC-PAN008 TaxID=3243332 RepID=UPI003F7422E3